MSNLREPSFEGLLESSFCALSRGAWGAFGCDGAWPQAYYDWIVQQNAGRVEREDCAPYTAADAACRDADSCDYAGAHMTGFYNKWYSSEEEMKELVYIAPVATTVLVSYVPPQIQPHHNFFH